MGVLMWAMETTAKQVFAYANHKAEPQLPLNDCYLVSILFENGVIGKLIAAVENLPEVYRAVFMLRDFDGLSYDEIADTLQTTVPAVKSRLHRARLALRADLSTYFDPKENA